MNKLILFLLILIPSISQAQPVFVDDSWEHGSGKVTLTTITDNVGVGLTSPGKKLDVSGTIRATAIEAPIVQSVTQTSHGFAVNNILKYNGTSYAKAQADNAADAEVVGWVLSVTDTNNFVLSTHGVMRGLSGLTDGEMYFLSTSVAGALQSSPPSVNGQVNKALLKATSTTTGIFNNMRGMIVTDAGINGGVSTPRGMGGVFYGGSGAIETGKEFPIWVPYDCTINQIVLLGDVVGSVQVDIWKGTYTNYETIGVGDSIVGSNPLVISSGKKSKNTLSGWSTTTLSKDDVLIAHVNSASVTSQLTISFDNTLR